MGLLGSFKSLFGMDEKPKKQQTAWEKAGSHFSTNQAFEYRRDAALYLWLLVQDPYLKVEKRAKSAKLLTHIFMEPYAMSMRNSDLWEKLTALEIRFAMWDRHYRAMIAKNKDDRAAVIRFFETKMVPAVGVVWHSCFHPEQVISQTTLMYQESPNPFGALQDGQAGGLDPRLAEALNSIANQGEGT